MDLLKLPINSPIIGISASLLMIDVGVFRGRERVFVGQDYIQAVLKAGGIPIILPVTVDEKALARQVQLIDGLILSGGYDVHPHFFGEEPHPLLEESYPDRDDFEIKLARLMAQHKKPILGICRGIQLLNVAFGGTLYQDLSLHSLPIHQHSQRARVDQPTHLVNLEEGTILRKIMNQSSIRTNSLHHQAVHQLAPGFTINAKTSDGIIEGIEKMDNSFILGVQWHPELLFQKDETMLNLFRFFINASAQTKGI